VAARLEDSDHWIERYEALDATGKLELVYR
jgi:hypothetical protein